MPKPANTNEDDYMGVVKALPCGCCGAIGPSSLHHIRKGQGLSQRAPHFLAIPLCWECHQGDNGLHGSQVLLKIYKTDELKMLAATFAVVFEAMRKTING